MQCFRTIYQEFAVDTGKWCGESCDQGACHIPQTALCLQVSAWPQWCVQQAQAKRGLSRQRLGWALACWLLYHETSFGLMIKEWLKDHVCWWNMWFQKVLLLYFPEHREPLPIPPHAPCRTRIHIRIRTCVAGTAPVIQDDHGMDIIQKCWVLWENHHSISFNDARLKPIAVALSMR